MRCGNGSSNTFRERIEVERLSLEPWLRGPVEGVHPVAGALIRCFEHALEDIEYWTQDLNGEQLWQRPGGVASVGFQIRHIGRSVDRLMTYAQGKQLDAGQLEALRSEMQPGAARTELLDEMAALLEAAKAAVRAMDMSEEGSPRYIGRKRIAVSFVGLLIHIAEHTQRHTGQAIITAKLVRAGR
jgi:uncharacterized damage-inducible protein DinB